MFDTLRYDVAGGVATIALDQPETRNALSDALFTALQADFEAGALGIALACDLIVAKEGVTFGTPEINVGAFPFMIMALIYRNLGRKKTNELLLLGERMSAEEALPAG